MGLRNGTAALGQSSEVKEFPEGHVGLGGIGSQVKGGSLVLGCGEFCLSLSAVHPLWEDHMGSDSFWKNQTTLGQV